MKAEISMVDSKILIEYKPIFKLSWIFSFIVGLLLVGEIIVFAIFPSINEPKELLIDFSNNWFIGLLRFDLLGMISYLMLIPITFAIYIVIKPSSKTISVFGMIFFLIGVTMFFSTNTGYSVLSLSKQFQVAKTIEEQNIIIASCQSMITLFKVNAFMLSYIVVSFSWIIISIAMKKCNLFTRTTTNVGIIAGSSGIIAEVFENTSLLLRWPAIVLYFLAIVFLLIWIIGIGNTFRINCKGKSH